MAVWRRDFTVPTGTSCAAAMSSRGRSAKKRRATHSRVVRAQGPRVRLAAPGLPVRQARRRCRRLPTLRRRSASPRRLLGRRPWSRPVLRMTRRTTGSVASGGILARYTLRRHPALRRQPPHSSLGGRGCAAPAGHSDGRTRYVPLALRCADGQPDRTASPRSSSSRCRVRDVGTGAHVQGRRRGKYSRSRAVLGQCRRRGVDQAPPRRRTSSASS